MSADLGVLFMLWRERKEYKRDDVPVARTRQRDPEDPRVMISIRKHDDALPSPLKQKSLPCYHCSY
jgi:hypothetical protein